MERQGETADETSVYATVKCQDCALVLRYTADSVFDRLNAEHSMLWHRWEIHSGH